MNTQWMDVRQEGSRSSEVRTLREDDIPGVAQLLARAMESDPAYRYFFPDPSLRFDGLRAFFAGNLRMHLPYACTHVSCTPDGQLLGTVTLRPPGGVEASTLTMLRAGLLPFARRNGVLAVGRMLWLKSAYDELELRASGGRLHRLVHMMAVAPRYQGRGHGGHLLARVLEQAGYPPAPTFLTTHTDANVRFYRRAGFEICDERTLQPYGSAAYPVWVMRKSAEREAWFA